MRALVVTGFTHWTPHWQTELEILQRHLDAGDTVAHLRCAGDMIACDSNQHHDLHRCQECIARRKEGLALLSAPVSSTSFVHLTAADRRELSRLPKRFKSLQEVRALKVDDFDIGLAVLSTMVSLYRDHQPPDDVVDYLVPRLLVSALSMYRSIQRYLDTSPVDRVYVFNGRFAYARAVLRACQSRAVPCFVHERGHDIHHYALYENTMPHDIDYVESRIRQAWAEAAGSPDRQSIAASFFEERARGTEQSWFSFVDRQREGLLPRDWDPGRRNIVIFNSSEDEFVAIGEGWENPLYADQHQGLTRIVESFRNCDDRVRLYLRIHPNLKGLTNAQTRALGAIRADWLTVIDPESPVSTYALLRAASAVVTFGSTVGIEATYWGAPSVLAGQTFYRNLGGTFNPASHDELVSLLVQDLAPRDRTAALMYGYYFKTFGTRFRYFEATGVLTGRFKGVTFGQRPEPLRRFENQVFQLYSRLRVLRTPRLG